jgi:hypothetical protein
LIDQESFDRLPGVQDSIIPLATEREVRRMMKMRFVAFLLPFILATVALAPAGAAQVKLNEILADPNSDWDGDGGVNSKLDEWVEIINAGSSAVDLGSYRLTDASAGTEFRFALSGTLAPGETRVYYGAEVVAWQSANGVSTYGLSLNNGGDTVYLYRIAGADTSVADSYAYDANQTRDDRAVGRLPDGDEGWVIFDGLNPYTGSDFPVASGCQPSPGARAGCLTPNEVSTWGRVKAHYSD